MKCREFEKYLIKNVSVRRIIDDDLKNHVKECPECKKVFFLDEILNARKESLEKAPETILINVRRRIYEAENHRSAFNRQWRPIFGRLLKPAAGFALSIALAFLFTLTRNNQIAVVNNLSERFDIPELKYIHAGDVLYVGKSGRVDFLLKKGAKMQLDSNTLLQIRSGNKISLSRGQLYLAAVNNVIEIETSGGVISVRNSKIKINTSAIKQDNELVTKATCVVFSGCAEIKSSTGTLTALRGDKIVLLDNGRIESINKTGEENLKEDDFSIDSPMTGKVFSAKEELCDCVYDVDFDSVRNRMHSKEYKEKRFPVRVFWENRYNIESRRYLNDALCFIDGYNSFTGSNGNSSGHR